MDLLATVLLLMLIMLATRVITSYVAGLLYDRLYTFAEINSLFVGRNAKVALAAEAQTTLRVIIATVLVSDPFQSARYMTNLAMSKEVIDIRSPGFKALVLYVTNGKVSTVKHGGKQNLSGLTAWEMESLQKLVERVRTLVHQSRNAD
jgi:hypothetical protein